MLNYITKFRRPRDLLLIFELLAFLLLFFKNNKHVDTYICILFIGLVLIIYISNFILGKISSGDNYIFLIVSMLLSLGLVTIYRINPSLGLLQLVWILVGLTGFYVTYFFLRAFKNLDDYTKLYAIGIFILLVSTLIYSIIFKRGREKGAYNWIRFGSFSIQPSEFAKILMMFLLASYYTKFRYSNKLKNFKNPSLLLMFVT